MLDTTHDDSKGWAALLSLTALTYYFFARPQLLKWGTRLGESQRRLPGDEIISQPNVRATHAVNIDAPPEAVWPWLAQMGRDGTGYYSFDFLNSQGIPSARSIRHDLPAPEVGMQLDKNVHIMALEAGRLLLYGGFSLHRPPLFTQDTTVLYLLERKTDGSTRLLVRLHARTHGLGSFFYNLFYEAVYCAAAIRQLQRIKQYAESMGHLHTP